MWDRLRLWIIRKLGGEHVRLEAFLASAEAGVVCDACDTVVRGQSLTREDGHEADLRKLMEAAYDRAQRRGVQLSGWKLRFVIYYFMGRKLGLWE
jgi:hypothetical protein